MKFGRLNLALIPLLVVPLMLHAQTPSAQDAMSPLPHYDKLIHLWSFQNNLVDSIGNLVTTPSESINQPIPISAIMYSEGIYDQAINLDGRTSHISVADFFLNQQFTLAALFYVNSLPDPGKVSVIISHHYASSMALTSDGRIRLGVMEEANWDDLYSEEGTIEPEKWHLVVGTYDGRDLQIHIFSKCFQRDEDWIKENPEDHYYWGYSISRPTNFRMNTFRNTGWSVGDCDDGCDSQRYQPLHGKIDEIAIWEQALDYNETERAMAPLISKFKVTAPPESEKVFIEEEVYEIDEIRILDPARNIVERRLPRYNADTGILERMNIYDRYNTFVFHVDFEYSDQGLVRKTKTSSVGEVIFEEMEQTNKGPSGQWTEGLFSNAIEEQRYGYRRFYNRENQLVREERSPVYGIQPPEIQAIEYTYNEFNRPRLVKYLAVSPEGREYLVGKQEYLYNAWQFPEYRVDFDEHGRITQVMHFFWENMRYYDRIEVWIPKRGLTDFNYFPHQGEFELHHIWIFDYLKKRIKYSDPESPLMLEEWNFQPYVYGQ